MMFSYPKDDTLKSLCRYLNDKFVKEGGIKKGGTWRTLRVPDRRHGGHGYS